MSIFEEDFNPDEMVFGRTIPVKTSAEQETKATSTPGARWYNSHNGFFCLPRALREDPSITHSEFRVLVALASFVMLKDEATPKLFTLKKITGMSESTISKATTSLQEKGWLKKQKRNDDSNIYRLTLPEKFKKKP